MSRALPLAFALTVGLSVSARAQTTEPKQFTQGTPIVIVGEVTSQPRNAGVAVEKKMQVGIGPQKTDYTLHLDGAQMFGYHGEEIASSDFKDKMWVRAEGFVMDDPRRIDVRRLQVIGGNLAGVKRTAYYRPGFDQGYVMTTGAPVQPAEFTQGTNVVVVGRVSSPPKGEIGEQKMQVAVGPANTDYTLHFRDAQLLGLFGQKIDEDGFDDGQWVRAEGRVMDDPRRIDVNRVQVIGNKGANLQSSIFFRPGLGQGYVTAVAGSRQTFPATTNGAYFSGPVVLVGRVSDDTDPLPTTRKIQVMSGGNEWTLHVADDATVVDNKGEKISLHDVDEDQWVRATGYVMDDLRLRVVQMENIGREEAFRTSSFYRTQAPLGYVERVAGDRVEFKAQTFSGTVVSVQHDLGYFIMRDNRGRTHRVYADTSSIRMNDRGVMLRDLQPGDRVTVHGRVTEF